MLAQAPPVEFDYVAILSRVLHTTCAGTLLGGLVYLRYVVAPGSAAVSGQDPYSGRRAAWATCVGVCTALLLLSGGYNFYLAITRYEKLPPVYHMLFGIKFLLGFVVFALAALLAGKTNAAARLQQRLTQWLTITLACVLVVYALGAFLRAVPKVPVGPGNEPAVASATFT